MKTIIQQLEDDCMMCRYCKDVAIAIVSAGRDEFYDSFWGIDQRQKIDEIIGKGKG